jgi:hypothetical protein
MIDDLPDKIIALNHYSPQMSDHQTNLPKNASGVKDSACSGIKQQASGILSLGTKRP